MALKCYFQQLLSYKYLLFFFFSFPPGEKGRGPIENSALSLSVGFKYRSNNRSLLLFFFKFPVVLLAGSAVERNREGSCLDADPLGVSQIAVLVCVFVCARLRPVIGWGDMRVCVCMHVCTFVHTTINAHASYNSHPVLRREKTENHQRESYGLGGHC